MAANIRRVGRIRVINVTPNSALCKTAEEAVYYLDEEYFNLLFMRHSERLTGYCASLLRSWDTAEDVVQETFARLLEKYLGNRFTDLIARRLIYRVAHNCCIDVLRLWNRWNLCSLDNDEFDMELVSSMSTPEETVLLYETGNEVMNAVMQLPEYLRAVILLDQLDFGTKEIASILGVTVGTVRNQRWKAHKILAGKEGLREQLEGWR